MVFSHLRAITRPNGNPEKYQENSFSYGQQLRLPNGQSLVKAKDL